MARHLRFAKPALRVRMGVAFSALALVLFAGSAALSAQQARRQAEHDAAARLQQTAARLAQRLDSDMALRLRDVERLASLADLLPPPQQADAWRSRLGALQAHLQYASWIGLAAPDGRVLAATQGLLEGRNVSQRPWFAQGLGGPMVADVHEAKLLASLLPSPADGEPIRFVDVAAPLRRGGQVVGVLGVHVTWAWAEARRREALQQGADAPAMEILIVDREGTVVLGPQAPAPWPAGGLAAQRALPAGLLTWSDGRGYLTALSPSQAQADYPGMGWTVVVRQPEAVAFAAANLIVQRMLLFGALAAVLFGAAAWWLSDRLTGPLRRVAAQAQRLMPEAALPAGHDEVDRLAASLGALLADLRQRERELAALNQALEDRVHERTRRLQQANEDLRSFSRNVSHDLRGPLSSMALLLRQVLQQPAHALAPPLRLRIESVARESERLHALTEDLLALSTVEGQALRTAPVDMHALAAEVVERLRLGAAVAVPVVRLGALAPVVGDAGLLRQVWTNLIANAFKFSAKAPAPCVTIDSHEEGAFIVYSVADNGVGFDGSQAARLFGVFQRLHPVSEFPGTGVGLSIVRRVVHRHGGRVWATSAPGQGARFCFALPRRGPVEEEGGEQPEVAETTAMATS